MTVNLLIVEDDPEIADLLKRYLTRKGFDLTIETNGEAGVARFRRDEFHVVLVDGLLPKGNGFFVCKEIRASPGGQNVGMIMMSAAYRSTSARREATEAGFDSFFAKPFAVADLAKALEDLALKYTGVRVVPQSQRPIKGTRGKAPSADTMPQKKRASKNVASPPPVVPRPGAEEKKATKPPVDVEKPAAKKRPLAEKNKSPERKSENKPVSKTDGAKAVSQSKEEVVSITEQADTIRLLLKLSREKFTGTLMFQCGDVSLELLVSEGVPFDAKDNMRETALGERMVSLGIMSYDALVETYKRTKIEDERFAEAALALGHLKKGEGIELIEAQFDERVQRAIAWSTGAVVVQADPKGFIRNRYGGVSLLDAILHHFLDIPDVVAAKKLLAEKKEMSPQATRDFESGLIAFAKLRPQSTLPGYLMSGQSTVAEMASAHGDNTYVEILAMWCAGMLYFVGEDVPSSSIAKPNKNESENAGVEDASAVEKIQDLYLKHWGRSHYAVLGVSRTASIESIRQSLLDARQRFGQADLANSNLGKASVAAKKLWGLLDQAEYVLTDSARRAAYDSRLEKFRPLNRHYEAEQIYHEGRLLLLEKKYSDAREAFVNAVVKRPNDVDALAYLGWTTILLGNLPKERGVALLQAASALNTQAVRPLFFLGLTAFRSGDLPEALSYLVQALRRCPGDKEIKSAIEVVRAKQDAQ